jgi:hypothetical protein
MARMLIGWVAKTEATLQLLPSPPEGEGSGVRGRHSVRTSHFGLDGFGHLTELQKRTHTIRMQMEITTEIAKLAAATQRNVAVGYRDQTR